LSILLSETMRVHAPVSHLFRSLTRVLCFMIRLTVLAGHRANTLSGSGRRGSPEVYMALPSANRSWRRVGAAARREKDVGAATEAREGKMEVAAAAAAGWAAAEVEGGGGSAVPSRSPSLPCWW
jgi:hypothetical protein